VKDSLKSASGEAGLRCSNLKRFNGSVPQYVSKEVKMVDGTSDNRRLAAAIKDRMISGNGVNESEGDFFDAAAAIVSEAGVSSDDIDDGVNLKP